MLGSGPIGSLSLVYLYEEVPEVKIIIIDLSKGVSFWEKIINNLKH